MSQQRNTSCRHYRGDRPCTWNKRDGSECASCTHADPVAERILIVKLDAVGDVLRSTCILPKLKEKHPRAFITWLTRAASAPLLAGNPYVDRAWKLDDPETLAHLQVQEFDLVINLDNAYPSGALASAARTRNRIGFTLSPDGLIVPTNETAEAWIGMASFDRLKKANHRTYQEHMYAICGFEPPIEHPVLFLDEEKTDVARREIRESWMRPEGKLVGLNTGAGGRWPLKMMGEERQTELVLRILQNPDRNVLLLGGPEEQGRNQRIMDKLPKERVRNAGCHHGLLDFAARISQCDALVCGDTLALHMATALKVPTVTVFCPTSLAEIHDYEGLIRKIQPEDCSCLCGYNRDCPTGRDCINRIPLEHILRELDQQLIREVSKN